MHLLGRTNASRPFSSSLMPLLALTIMLVSTNTYTVFAGARPGTGPLVLATMLPLLMFSAVFWRHTLVGMRTSPEIVALLLLVPLSIVWSTHAPTTAERAVPLLITSFFGLTLGAFLSTKRLILFLNLSVGLALVFSFCAIFFVPASQGTTNWPEAWNGVFNQKNGLGMASFLGIMSSVSMAIIFGGRLRLLGLCLLTFSILLLVGSESRTSQIFSALMLISFATSIIFRRTPFLWALGFLLFVLALALVMTILLATSAADPLFDSIGRKPTLSGRIPLWSIIWPWVEARPLLGYGYMAYWRPDAEYVLAMAYNPKLFFSPFYSHNGVLEVLLAVGFIGLGLLVAGILGSVIALLRTIRTSADQRVATCILILVVGLLAMNFTESFFLARSSITWTFFVALLTNARRRTNGASIK